MAIVVAIAGMAVLGVGLARTAAMPAPAATPRNVAGGPSALPGSGSIPEVSAPPSTPSGSTPPATVGPGSSPGPEPSGGPTLAERRMATLAVSLQAELDRVRARLAIPGAAVTILFPDGSRWFGGSGLADIAARTPVTATTAFALASISKTYTSALVLQLVGEGRLRLSDPAAGLLPPLRLAIDRRITVAMLLNHTSGLADYFLNPKIDRPLQSRPTAMWSADQALGYVGKSVAPPGARYFYSNTNYLLLGLIAERLTGEPLGVSIQTRFLEPLGLAATWDQIDTKARATLAHGYRLPGTKLTAKAVDLADGSGIAPFRSVVTAAGGAGAMAGTTDDLARWAQALYGGRVLGPDGTALLLGGFSPTTPHLPGVPYGYGVQAFSVDGHPSLGHSGRLLGFRGAVRQFPIDGLTIAVLTNQSRADPGEIVRALLNVIFAPPLACRICSTPD
ncbi:MAG: serine hydrolase [Chloroflexi bacterium]|nr:serine hydrolase [Chloroflexota bacterium]